MDQQTYSTEITKARRKGDTEYLRTLQEAAESGTLGDVEPKYAGRMDGDTYDALTDQAREQGDTARLHSLQDRAERGEVAGRGAAADSEDEGGADGALEAAIERTVEAMRDSGDPFVRQLESVLGADDVEGALQAVREDRQARGEPEAVQVVDDILTHSNE